MEWPILWSELRGKGFSFFIVMNKAASFNLPPLGRHVLKGINCATESMGIGLSWFVFHFS